MRAKRAFFDDVEDSLRQTISPRLHVARSALAARTCHTLPALLRDLLCIHLVFRIECDDGCHEVCVQFGRAGYMGSKLTFMIGAKIYQDGMLSLVPIPFVVRLPGVALVSTSNAFVC